jgi:hypothetical protein
VLYCVILKLEPSGFSTPYTLELQSKPGFGWVVVVTEDVSLEVLGSKVLGELIDAVLI